jgi:DNA-binding MarR family transcriptional regulator
MSGAAADFEHHLGYWLRFVSNQVSHAFRDRVAKYGVTVAEWVALRSLHNRAPCTLGELAEQIGVDAGVTSRLVDRLVRKKLASRKAGRDDRRFVTLALSPAGKRLVLKLAREADRNDERFFTPLTEADRSHLVRIMKALVTIHGLTAKPLE